jgi:hypothetical protein
MAKFIKANKIIFIGSCIAFGVILSYIFSMNLHEWFEGAELWFNLLFQLSMGYLISLIFYVMQVYLPGIKRTDITYPCIENRLNYLVRYMLDPFDKIAELKNMKSENGLYSEQDLKKITKFSFWDEVNVLDASTRKNLIVREWILTCMAKTEKEIDELFKYYPFDITPELSEALNDVMKSTYHSTMIIFCQGDGDYRLDSNGTILQSYYDCIQPIRDIKESVYSS